MRRVAVAGAGRIGEVHLRTLARHPDVGEVLLHDPDVPRAEALAAAPGAGGRIRLAGSAEALFAEGVDAVVIASPTPTHAELLERAIQACLPVFCEKPVAVDLAETRRLAELARRTGARVQVGFHYRFDPALRDMAARLPTGGPGPFLRIHSTTGFEPSADYLAGAGGIIADKLVHELDLLRWLTGSEVASIAALAPRPTSATGFGGEPLTVGLLLELAHGGLAAVWGAYRSAAGFDLVVEAEVPTEVLVVGNRRAPSEAVAPLPPSSVTDFRERFAEAYEAELEAFLDFAAGDGPSPCDLDEAVRTQRVVETAQVALARREIVVVDDDGGAGGGSDSSPRRWRS
jgi:myo-inositol 2-dehydrogenase/D-chiro-inositol 1-dehydrogenase